MSCYHSPPFHAITSISNYHTLFPSLILSYHLHAGLSNAHSPTPNSAFISPLQIIYKYTGMLYARWNSSPATHSACTSHCTAHTTHSPVILLPIWMLQWLTSSLIVLPTFPHSQMTPPQVRMPPLSWKQVQATWESPNTTDCHPNLGKIFLLCWSIIIKYTACVCGLYLTETVIQ